MTRSPVALTVPVVFPLVTKCKLLPCVILIVDHVIASRVAVSHTTRPKSGKHVQCALHTASTSSNSHSRGPPSRDSLIPIALSPVSDASHALPNTLEVPHLPRARLQERCNSPVPGKLICYHCNLPFLKHGSLHSLQPSSQYAQATYTPQQRHPPLSQQTPATSLLARLAGETALI